jgi:O-antigen ligase
LVTPQSGTPQRAALILAGGSVVAVLFSIAVSHILLGAALLTLIVGRIRPSFPPVALPLAVFVGWTLLSLALSPDPLMGVAQLKKFYVYTVLLVVYTTFRGAEDVRRVAVAWAIIATASGAWGFVQFGQKRSEALSKGFDVYLHYVGDRATGFMSHWMTFSAEQMMAGLLVTALLLYGTLRPWLWVCAGVIAGSIAIAWTRGVWIATVIACVYLIAVRRPKMLLLAPVVLVAGLFIAPRSVQERAISIVRPHGETDSNTHRAILFRTGVVMIRTHPWFGLGPDMIKRDFMKYVPEDVPRPLPEGYYQHLHNFYMQYAADRGIPAVLALLWLIVKAVVDFGRAIRALPAANTLQRAVLHGCIAGIIAILVEGVFETNLGDSEVLTMFLAVIGAGYVTAREVGHG